VLFSCHPILLLLAASGLQLGKIIPYPPVQLSESGSDLHPSILKTVSINLFGLLSNKRTNRSLTWFLVAWRLEKIGLY